MLFYKYEHFQHLIIVIFPARTQYDFVWTGADNFYDQEVVSLIFDEGRGTVSEAEDCVSIDKYLIQNI